MAIIPMDVLYSCILPRLPVKTLTRFKSVSKSWQTIFSSHEFIHLHHQHASRLIVFVNLASQEFRIHELDSSLSPSVHWYNPASTSVCRVASCEFFLLIDFRVKLELVLLNPSTGRYYHIPYPPSEGHSVRYGMYLDVANNDYKVVRINQKVCLPNSFEEPIQTTREVMVYSLRTNKWRLIERKTTQEKSYAWWNVVIGHLLYIVFAPKFLNTIKRIGCFDILAEKWTTDVPMPPINVLGLVGLAVLDGLLCVTGMDTEEMGSPKWCLWVMKEYGIKDSWFKLISIASDNIWDWHNNTRPIAFRKGSQDEVLCTRSRNSKWEYIWYNVREKKATTATIDGNYGYICKGSLADFPGGRNMKLHRPKQAEETTTLSENKRQKLVRC